ncbi:hypothetical protein WJX81_000826 [Elliptochloris bilobata]|uniref:Uncharacterized protein n=1 Tax=Elliptochloris bilobata TaxID=381761 RepID=A0AAW1SDB9_9CHLO
MKGVMAKTPDNASDEEFPGADCIKKECDYLFNAKEMCSDTPFARTETFTSDLEDMMNCCIAYSCNVCAIYKSAFAYFDRDNVAMPGIAMFFKIAEVSERNACSLKIDFMNRRGGRVKFEKVAAPCTEWDCKEYGPVCYAFVKSLAITSCAAAFPTLPVYVL